MSTTQQRSKKMSWLWIIPIVIVVIVIAVLGLKRLERKLFGEPTDYSDLSWTQAFEQVHARTVARYPFTEWKGIDWDELYAQTAPRIAEAEASGDREAYTLAWREYACALHDGHVKLSGKGFDLREKAVAGGYGLGIIRLDDGRVIVHVLLDDGPAAQAGIVWGAEILTWNGQPIADALAQTSLLWAIVIPATQEGRELEQLRYLVRAPVGTEATFTYRNPEADAAQTITLTASDDQLQALALTTQPAYDLTIFLTSMIQSEILPSGYGYIAITGFLPTLGSPKPPKIFERAITKFIKQDVPGIIIDVRGNVGGADEWVPQMVSYFYTAPDFYEYVAYHDAETGALQISPEETLTIEPRAPHFAGPVIVLVDNAAISSAEGLALAIQNLPQGQVMGMYSTHGSFAVDHMGVNKYLLPEDLTFEFFAGAAWDENKVIQVDANADGVGGVTPDIRVPLTEETVYEMYVEGKDVVLEMAIAELDAME
jgi:carboxyl-terminal processing protease